MSSQAQTQMVLGCLILLLFIGLAVWGFYYYQKRSKAASNTPPDSGQAPGSAQSPGSAQQPQRPYMRLPRCNLFAYLPSWRLDEWSALVMGRVDLARDDVLLLEVLDLVAERGIGGLCLDADLAGRVTPSADGRDFVALGQGLSTWGASSRGVTIILALSVFARSNLDLQISWRLYLLNVNVVGPASSPYTRSHRVVNVWDNLTGSEMYSTGLPAGAETEARTLVQTVNYCLLQALDAHGVGRGDLVTV